MPWDLFTPANWYSRTVNAADKQQLAGFGWSWALALSCSIPSHRGETCGSGQEDQAWPSSGCCSAAEPGTGCEKRVEGDEGKERGLEKELCAGTASCLVISACLASVLREISGSPREGTKNCFPPCFPRFLYLMHGIILWSLISCFKVVGNICFVWRALFAVIRHKH